MPQRIAERVNSLLGPRFFFIPPRSAKRSVEPSFGKRIQKRFCLQQAATFLRSQRKGIGPRVQCRLILVNDEFRTKLPRVRVTKLDHLGKFVARVDMQQGERDLAREKRLLRQTQHYRGIFADRIEHDRARKFRRRFAQDVDALCLKSLQVIQSPRDKRRRTPAVGGSLSRFRKRDFRCVRHRPRFTNKKPTCQGFRRWVGYNLVVKGLLQSWLFTHTRHSSPRRHLWTTTTGSRF